MPSYKKKIYGDRSVNEERIAIRSMYDEKYFNLFLNSRECDGLTREQAEYTLRKFWGNGTIACFNIENLDLIGFAPFVAIDYDMYNFPIHVNLINEKGSPFIPNKVMLNNEDVVLGWALHSRTPIYTIVNNYLDRITDVEMAIRMNVKAHKIPLAIAVSDDSETDAKTLNDNIESDEYKFFIKSGRENMLTAVMSGAPFLLDKLHAYKVSLENELLTFLGINNIAMEKKERLITDEAEGNNELIENYALIIDECLDEFSKQIKKVLGFNVSWKRRQTTIEEQEETNNENIEE